jgi:hypothetical protein
MELLKKKEGIFLKRKKNREKEKNKRKEDFVKYVVLNVRKGKHFSLYRPRRNSFFRKIF